ncbi:MAG: thioredoxin-disulfide reductase [Minisyncoccia bacterium]
MNNYIYDVIIIGGGPSGLTAAFYAGRAKLNTLLFSGKPGGGELFLAIIIEDFPGFPNGISGFELLNLMTEQAKKFNTQIINKDIIKVDFSSKPYKVYDEDNNEYQAKGIIIATGGKPRWLGLEKEKEFIGKGISVCAICDGAFFQGKIVAVVGGGDVALEDAVYLTQYANKVYLIHRRNEFKASKFWQEQVFKNPKIEIIFNSEVQKLIGETKLEGIIIKNNQNNTETELKVDGLFLAIGFDPNSDIFKGQLEIDDHGYIKTIDNVKTSKEGVYAAGDVSDFKYRQVITASGFGAMAGIEIEKWLRTLND